MEARLKNLTSIFVLCFLFFLFFPVSKWLLLFVFAAIDYGLYRIDEKRKVNVYILLSILFVLSFCLFYPNFAAVFFMCLCSFLFHAITIEPSKNLMIIAVLFVIHLMKNPSLPLLIILIALFLFHLILTIMITSRNKFQLSQRMKLIVTLGIGVSIVIGFIPYLARGVKNLLSIGMYSLTNVLSRLISDGFNIAEPNEKQKERINKLTSTDPDTEKFQYTEYVTNPYLYSILMIILFILFTVAIIYIINKRKSKLIELKGKKLNTEENLSNLSKIERKKGKSSKMNPPSSIPVRKLVYHFEKEMKGVHMRKNGETFHDWLNRINLYKNELNNQLSEIYEKSRYGEEDIRKNDLKVFSEGLKQIKNELKKSESRYK